MKAFVSLVLALNLTFGSVFGNVLHYFDMSESKDNFFRLHIRANSDSEADQALKLLVRDAVLEVTRSLTSEATSKGEAMTAVRNGLEDILYVAERTVGSAGSAQTVTAEIKREYFPYKEYGNFYLPSGYYDSLIIELGSGEGQNWWCVIFPAVCISGSAEAETVMAVDPLAVPDDLRLAEDPAPKRVKYEFWIVNVIKDIFGIR